ncbi:MAG: hypothetical protein F6K42_09580 [Leptolyngbya sp. SIO1D8]|nr:hypothetical protein [Leptolyngbya sp. SIO1D8]
MTASPSLAELDRFVMALEGRIQAVIAQTTEHAPPTIRCRFQQGRLLVLSEDTHAASTAPARNQRFRKLAIATGTGLTETEFPEALLTAENALPVRLYLRQRGTASPYAARNWSWKPADVVSDLFDHRGFNAPPKTPHDQQEPSEGALVLLSPSSHFQNPSTPEQSPDTVATPPNQLRTKLRQALQGLSGEQRWQTLVETWQDLPWRSITGLVAIGLTIGSIAYGVSRPCLIGSCNRRQAASDLSQTALTQLKGTPTPSAVNQAHADVLKAVRLLSAIPPWSPHYDTAQADLARYRSHLADLEWVIKAQKNATIASEKSQNPPHPVPVWVEVHLLWQKAITDLRRVPEESVLAGFTRQKLTEYEANHTAIGQRLAAEERAEANLNQALQMGQLAVARTEEAANLSAWLMAQQEWQRAVTSLSQIPQGTLAYDEARSLLEDYRTQLMQTRTRVNLEKAGERSYQAGLTNAAEAQTAERVNQWTLALDKWRRANAHMRQVPQNTLHYAEAQRQLANYQAALKRAEGRLQQAVALQTLDEDLEDLCPLNAGICTFSYNTQQIDLTLREPYDSAFRQSISPPSNQGNLAQTTSVVEQTHQLVQDIMRLGNRVQLPISIYDNRRQFIARYKPEYGGFAKEP